MKTTCYSRTQVITATVGALLLTVVGCSQPLSTREKSTLVGGGLGAATGAIVGATVGAPGAGAAIGGALGAGAGALTGDQVQSRDEDLERQDRQLEA
jgi:outer membrane lipoprotein SlyB